MGFPERVGNFLTFPVAADVPRDVSFVHLDREVEMASEQDPYGGQKVEHATTTLQAIRHSSSSPFSYPTQSVQPRLTPLSSSPYSFPTTSVQPGLFPPLHSERKRTTREFSPDRDIEASISLSKTSASTARKVRRVVSGSSIHPMQLEELAPEHGLKKDPFVSQPSFSASMDFSLLLLDVGRRAQQQPAPFVPFSQVPNFSWESVPLPSFPVPASAEPEDVEMES